MARILITIDTENSAFEGDNVGSESARILRELASKIETSNLVSTFDRSLWLKDVNGNRLGKMEVTDTQIF